MFTNALLFVCTSGTKFAVRVLSVTFEPRAGTYTCEQGKESAMRFASIPKPKPQEQRTPAADFIRRMVAPESVAGSLSVPAKTAELPRDLDQRVRLVGEW